jgi:dolichyl-diphosphooligosaccharide--protein glycosyltransferase
VAPYGVFILFLNPKKWTQSTFLMLWAFASYFFCLKMSRLIILAGPITAALNGAVFGFVLDWCWDQIYVHPYSNNGYPSAIEKARKFYHTHRVLYYVRLALFAGLLLLAYNNTKYVTEFRGHAHQIAHSVSEPRIMFQHKFPNGQTEIIDDYRQSYQWLRVNTPSSSRILSWWDYGYQITGMR